MSPSRGERESATWGSFTWLSSDYNNIHEAHDREDVRGTLHSVDDGDDYDDDPDSAVLIARRAGERWENPLFFDAASSTHAAATRACEKNERRQPAPGLLAVMQNAISVQNALTHGAATSAGEKSEKWQLSPGRLAGMQKANSAPDVVTQATATSVCEMDEADWPALGPEVQRAPARMSRLNRRRARVLYSSLIFPSPSPPSSLPHPSSLF